MGILDQSTQNNFRELDICCEVRINPVINRLLYSNNQPWAFRRYLTLKSSFENGPFKECAVFIMRAKKTRCNMTHTLHKKHSLATQSGVNIELLHLLAYHWVFTGIGAFVISKFKNSDVISVCSFSVVSIVRLSKSWRLIAPWAL